MIAITNGKIFTITQGVIEKGTVLIEAGQIRAVGSEVLIPKGTRIIDATDKYVFPGLIDAHSHLGLLGEPGVWANMDINEDTDPNTAHLRAIDAINPDDLAIADVRQAGVTTVYTGPGSANVIGGTGIAIKTYGLTPEEMLIPGTEGMKMALGENPKKVYGEYQKKYPATRMGNAAVLREALVEASNYLVEIDYARKEAANEEKEAKLPDRNLTNEALGRVLRREIKARIHCHRKDDILTAIRIAKEFNLDYVIEHCTEGHKIAEYLADHQVQATVGPLLMCREKMELNDVTLKNPGILAEAGVKVAIQVDGASDTKWLALHAGIAVREGMNEEEALRAITINAAEIIGAADRVGSLEVGKDGDVAIFSGHPFETMTVCERVLINGEVVYG